MRSQCTHDQDAKKRTHREDAKKQKREGTKDARGKKKTDARLSTKTL
jgi:hypothetical protein